VSEPVISIMKIVLEAQAAAKRYASVNDACPYPFGSDAAHAFKAAFLGARKEYEAKCRQQGAVA
jgi:hypothetical protein